MAAADLVISYLIPAVIADRSHDKGPQFPVRLGYVGDTGKLPVPESGINNE